MEAAKKLRVVGRAGVGVDNVDVEAATQQGVVVMNTPGGNTITTAELTFFMLGALARHIAPAQARWSAGKWDRKLFQGVEINGKTLGVLGMGRIGGEVAKRALAFGMRVIAYDPFLTEARAQHLGVELVAEADAVYAAADFITVHMPVTEQTRGMLNADAFAKMKPGVRIVNCARGEIIEEKDLIAAIGIQKSRRRGARCFFRGTIAGGSSVSRNCRMCCSRRIWARARRKRRRNAGSKSRKSSRPICSRAKCATP